MSGYERHCRDRGLIMPAGLLDVLQGEVGRRLHHLIYWPDGYANQANSLAFAQSLLSEGIWLPPPNLLPLLPIDDASIACALCMAIDEDDDDPDGVPERAAVVRWHLGAIDEAFQGALVDTDAAAYLASVDEELAIRDKSLADVKGRAANYYRKYVATGKLPRDFVERPVQMACQNIVVGLATLRQDVTFDGLRVGYYLTCEAPHLATHEADRGLTALLLCDAFQGGGTMEVRFGDKGCGQHVPAALSRFARSLGTPVGLEDPRAITPAEARQLFLAVTPMPDELRGRVTELLDGGSVRPERLCFVLMSAIWSAIELDYMLGTTGRATTILRGGADPEDRRARLPELEICRAALMAGTLFRRLSNTDAAAVSSTGIRVFEDAGARVEWSVRTEIGAVALAGYAGDLPWAPSGRPRIALAPGALLLAVPRALPLPGDFRRVRDLMGEHPDWTVALLTPADMVECVPDDIPLLAFPDRLAELDSQIERRLAKSRVGRA
jgi:hypothetical protein